MLETGVPVSLIRRRMGSVYIRGTLQTSHATITAWVFPCFQTMALAYKGSFTPVLITSENPRHPVPPWAA